MKKLMLAAFLMFGGIAFVNAQNTDSTSTTTPTQTETQDRQKIEVRELPDAIRTSLESQDYQNWTVSSAYRSTQKDSSDETKSMEVYVVELKNGADSKTVRFDKDGKKLDDAEKKDQK